MFETDYVDKFQDVIDSTKPRYECIKQFRSVNVGDIVHVKLRYNNMHNPVYITKNRHTHCTNLEMLDEYFDKI